MKYMLPMGFLGVTSGSEEVSKFGVEMRFFIVFDNIAASLHRNRKRWASERTLSYDHDTMPRNTIDFGYNSGHVAF